MAPAIILPSFEREKLETLSNKIAQFTVLEDGVQLFLNELEAAGVIFFVLPQLQKTYLDGAAFWETANPAIIYTGRLKRLDNFWFTVAHEVAHVLLHLEKGMVILDDEKFSEKDELETEANRAAGNWLKHPQIGSFAAGMRYVPHRSIEDAAKLIGVHPSIISGTLVHRKVLGGNRLHKFNKNPVDFIPAKFIKD